MMLVVMRAASPTEREREIQPQQEPEKKRRKVRKVIDDGRRKKKKEKKEKEKRLISELKKQHTKQRERVSREKKTTKPHGFETGPV